MQGVFTEGWCFTDGDGLYRRFKVGASGQANPVSARAGSSKQTLVAGVRGWGAGFRVLGYPASPRPSTWWEDWAPPTAWRHWLRSGMTLVRPPSLPRAPNFLPHLVSFVGEVGKNLTGQVGKKCESFHLRNFHINYTTGFRAKKLYLVVVWAKDAEISFFVNVKLPLCCKLEKYLQNKFFAVKTRLCTIYFMQ